MRIAAVIAALLLSGCLTTSAPEGLSYARPPVGAPVPGPVIATLPTGATLTYPDGTCTTPCRTEYPEKIQITVAKAGYAALKLDVPPRAADIVFELEPVGRTADVEEASLPPL